jgi:hypothetical protein
MARDGRGREKVHHCHGQVTGLLEREMKKWRKKIKTPNLTCRSHILGEIIGDMLEHLPQ